MIRTTVFFIDFDAATRIGCQKKLKFLSVPFDRTWKPKNTETSMNSLECFVVQVYLESVCFEIQ